MGFFTRDKRDPVERLESALKDKQSAREKLADRLSAAEAALVEKRAAAQRLAMAGAADAELDRAEAATRAAEHRAITLRAALSQLDEQIGEIERELADAKTQRDRDMVADELDSMASAIATAAPGYDAASVTLIEAITKSSASMLEASRFAAGLDVMRRDVGAASALICAELRNAATRTRSGQAKIALREPPEPEAAPAPKIEREMTYTLSWVRWQENGAIRTAPPYVQVDLPSALLPSALHNNHVDYLDSPRSQNLMQAYGSGHSYVAPHPDDSRLVDLDALAASEEEEETVEATS
jgi:hypothetical protein